MVFVWDVLERSKAITCNCLIASRSMFNLSCANLKATYVCASNDIFAYAYNYATYVLRIPLNTIWPYQGGSSTCLFSLLFKMYFPCSLSYHFVNVLGDECKYISVIVFSNKCWISVWFAIAKNWFKSLIKVIDRIKAVTQHFLE